MTIGRSIPRFGAIARVTGAQRYAADIHLDNALQVKLLSLPCARARIISIDTIAAAAIDGVHCVMTAADLPQPMPRYGPAFDDRPVLAVGETKFFGEPVAAVAAETEDAAERAASLVRIEFEELPAVLTVADALDPSSPLVQDAAVRKPGPHTHTNTLESWQFGWGDVSRAEADLVINNEYSFPMVTHFAIEPHAFLAAPDEGGVTIWTPVQHPYVLQRVVASALRWPLSRVSIVSPDPGGGFGGKGWPKVEPLMAFLALRCGRPVRLVWTLEETFQAVRRASALVHARTGFDRSGLIVFQEIEANFLIGAYADVGARVVGKASYAACGPYRTPSARIVARALLSHTTPSTAFRGFGTPQASWAVESQLNEAARQLGVDRVQIRRRNLPARGEAFIPHETPADGDWQAALSQAAQAISWGAPLAQHHGRGLSLGLKSSSTASASLAIVRLHHDGSASILSGTSDMGQGARTVLAQIAAQELGITTDSISVMMGDTAIVPFDSSTSASRSTVFMGNAVIKACEDIKSQLRRMASEAFEVAEDGIDVAGGLVGVSGRRLSYGEVLQAYFGPPRGEVIGVGQERSKYIADHPLGGKPAFWELMCAAAEVRVDLETGAVEVLKLALVSDVGKALNPQQVEAQDEGAAVMGLGHSLMEQLLLDEHGRIRNLGSLDYRIPTIEDIARQLSSSFIENGDGPGPYGAKGAGEGGILAVAAAIGSAVNEAASVTIRDLPLTPERVWRAIQEEKNTKRTK
ncbi:MAG TPA: xanthine dehydrogenase family protein molybdopterin-binding subunit [Vicinamibacterales bacterium]|nr:xanthine dehydrogenase family protein molybdopterin-binding subunit [Vicinamibacterales bacterium]